MINDNKIDAPQVLFKHDCVVLELFLSILGLDYIDAILALKIYNRTTIQF